MRRFKHIINRLLLFELYTSEARCFTRVWQVSIKRNKISLIEQKNCDLNNTEKWKHSPAILLITGNKVLTKKFNKEDVSIKKITDNPELLWKLHSFEDSEEQTISFLRKDLVEELAVALDKNCIYVLDKWINNDENLNKEQIVADFYNQPIKLSDFHQNRTQINLLSLVVYYKLRLLLLLFFFIIVLGNFFLNTHYRQEYETVQSELYLNQRNNRKQQNNQKMQGRIQSQYESIPDRSFALIADRIASYIPPHIILNSLIFAPLEGTKNNTVLQNKKMEFKNSSIMIKGETDIPGAVSLFSQYLDRDHLFSNIKIHSLVRDKDSSLFTFELIVELEH